MTLKVLAASRSCCLSCVDSSTDFHSQKMLNAPMSSVKNGAGNTTEVSTSMQERHNMGRKYLVAFSVVIFNALLVVTFPACFALRSPAMKSTAIASITAM